MNMELKNMTKNTTKLTQTTRTETAPEPHQNHYIGPLT